jgi:hypothetical protein
MINEMESMQNFPRPKVLAKHSPGRTEENQKRLRIFRISANIRNNALLFNVYFNIIRGTL